MLALQEVVWRDRKEVRTCSPWVFGGGAAGGPGDAGAAGPAAGPAAAAAAARAAGRTPPCSSPRAVASWGPPS